MAAPNKKNVKLDHFSPSTLHLFAQWMSQAAVSAQSETIEQDAALLAQAKRELTVALEQIQPQQDVVDQAG